jgi:hypothetical protein
LLLDSIQLQRQCRVDFGDRFAAFDSPPMHALAEQLFATPRE